MANYNIGPKIGIEGEREFRAQISRINKEYSAMESYTKAVSTAMLQQGKSQDLLASKANGLRQQLGLQEQKFRELSNALEKAKASYGENSQEVLRFQGAILDVKNTTAALQRELDATDDELRRMAAGIEDVGDAAEIADDKVLSFGDVLKAGIASGAILNGLERTGEVIVEVGRASIEAAAEVKAANAQFSQTFGDLEDTATRALRSVSKETGIAVTRLQSGYTALYAFTRSVGGDQTTALNISQRALRAAADSAAYYDRTMEDATETLQSFLKGNYENDAALGIAATETTRNAKANELYAKSFKELTEAQKVDTLLAMVEAGNAASGALGQAAREADSWANVTGELAESWRQFLAAIGGPVMERLIPVIQGLTDGLQRLTEVSPWQALSTGIEDFQAGLAAADEALASSNSEIEATTGLAERYLTRLEDLAEAGLTTEDAMREYAATVGLLNELMPELNLTIDEGTGRLSKNTTEIRNNIGALRDQAREQAKQAYYAAIIDELTAVEKDRYAAEMRLYELQQKQNELIAQGADANVLYASAQALASGNAEEFYRSLSEEDRALMQVLEELAATEQQLSAYDDEIARHTARLDEAAAANERFGRSTEDMAADFKSAFSGMKIGMDESMRDLLNRAKSLGYDTGAGIAKGVRDAIPEVESAFTKLAKRGQGAYMHTLDQHSPSRVMRAAGKDSGRGAALGVEDAIPDMERAMMRLAQSGSNTYLQEQLDYVAQYPSMVAGTAGYGGSTTTNNRSVTYGGISININTQPGQDAQGIADVVIQELTARLGREEASF